MRLLRIICILALLVGLSSVGFAEETKRAATVLDIEGKVEVRTIEGEAWTAVEKGAVLSEGDIIKTAPDSWAVLNLDGEGEIAVVEINENSQLLLSELIENKEKGTQKTLLDLAIGKVLIKAEKLHTDESKFEVKTPTSVVGVRGTSFSVEVEALE